MLVDPAGDYKAMNVFVPVGYKAQAEGATPETEARIDHGPALIDFQWTGVGLGMLDVAMHLYHSVELAAMEGDGATNCVELYSLLATRFSLQYSVNLEMFAAQVRRSCCDTTTLR